MRFDLNTAAKEELIPFATLILYKGNQQSRFYVEYRRIDDNGNMGVGKPLTRRGISDLVKAYQIKDTSLRLHGIIPSYLLYLQEESERMIWFNPPQKRQFYFHSSLAIPNGMYQMPGIIYVAEGEKLSVFAFKGNKITSESILYHAPFFNVTDSNVCLGYADLKKPRNPSYQQYIEYWEKRFWLTEFTHLGRVNPTKENLVWVMEKSKEKFNTRQLIAAKNDEYPVLKLKYILR